MRNGTFLMTSILRGLAIKVIKETYRQKLNYLSILKLDINLFLLTMAITDQRKSKNRNALTVKTIKALICSEFLLLWHHQITANHFGDVSFFTGFSFIRTRR
jgi:hypothetical protein